MSVVDLRASVISSADGSLIIRLDGEIDVESCRLVNECVTTALDAGESQIVLDLRYVEFIDSRGLRALLIAQHQTADRGGQLVVSSPSKRVHDLLLMTGLDRALNLRQ